jgi:hypothetical protein
MRRVPGILAVFICLALIFCSLSCKTINKNSKPAVNMYEEKILSQQEKANLRKTIATFTNAIESEPQYSGAYYNRAIAYYFNQEYEKSWQDVCTAQALGGEFKLEFLGALKKALEKNRAVALAIHPRKNPRYYKKPYVFTEDWFTTRGRVPLWKKTLTHLKGKPNVNYLEIGVFEGRSLIWMLENILTHPSSRATVIDTFDGAYYKNFLENFKVGAFAKKVEVIKGYSQVELRELLLESFDVIYIDGSHYPESVLIDAVLSFGLLKVGGIMIFDDYKMDNTEIAIDAFTGVFQQHIEVLHKGWQLVIRKE